MAKKIEEVTGTGRRKRAVAAIRMRPGSGKIEVNGREFENYFTLELQRNTVLAPLEEMKLNGRYDLMIRTRGGGIDGQAVAARLGIARALVVEDETRRADLKALGFLRRDPRRRERKKYGHKGARKSFQFSKR
ncbi:MAG: 30S ribosomal protein S9 [Verrucomicrobia bacterium]|nr:30S ribosomal protein S9 [Verrucomicrobiota bacterium]